MSDDREQTNDGARPPLSFEEMEEILKSVVPDAEKVAMENILNEIKEDFAAAELTNEPTEEELEAEARDRTFHELQQKCNRAGVVLKACIKIKRKDPNSELFKAAKEGLELLGQIENGNTNNVDRYKTIIFLCMELLQGESEKQPKANGALQENLRLPRPDTKAVVIDLSKYSKSKSFNMLTDLISDTERKGVHCYNKRELKTLKELLKKHGDKDVADALTWADDNIKLGIPFGRIFITPKK